MDSRKVAGDFLKKPPWLLMKLHLPILEVS